SEKMNTSKKYEKEWNEYNKIEKALLDKIGDDDQKKELLAKLLNLSNDLNFIDIEDTFREGFILGAQLALEICGVKCDDE
ncbi:MAG: hypothetical protein K2L61_00755, partial [Clostridia bacterium]|nr:hypothetical protein [Clostridia bacterium]